MTSLLMQIREVGLLVTNVFVKISIQPPKQQHNLFWWDFFSAPPVDPADNSEKRPRRWKSEVLLSGELMGNLNLVQSSNRWSGFLWDWDIFKQCRSGSKKIKHATLTTLSIIDSNGFTASDCCRGRCRILKSVDCSV